MIIVKIIMPILFVGIGILVQGQNVTGNVFFEKVETSSEDGSLTVVQDVELVNLLGIHIESNKRNSGVDGFRVQLYLGSSNNAKKESAEAKSKFLSRFPDQAVYVTYEAPFWRVQAGDFRSKNDALSLYHELRRTFPSCYPVPVSNVDYNKFD